MTGSKGKRNSPEQLRRILSVAVTEFERIDAHLDCPSFRRCCGNPIKTFRSSRLNRRPLPSRLTSGYFPVYSRYLNNSGLIPRRAQASAVR